MKHNNIYLVGFMGCGKTSVLKKIRQKKAGENKVTV